MAGCCALEGQHKLWILGLSQCDVSWPQLMAAQQKLCWSEVEVSLNVWIHAVAECGHTGAPQLRQLELAHGCVIGEKYFQNKLRRIK